MLQSGLLIRIKYLIWVLLFIIGTLPAIAITDSIYGEFNGHCYIAVCDTAGLSEIANGDTVGFTWTEANTISAQMGGHLAAINSQEENDFIYSIFANDKRFWKLVKLSEYNGPWIGGRQAWGSQEPDQGWGWITGEPFVFQNWAQGEPNDFGGEEQICFCERNGIKSGQWNDYSSNFYLTGFIVEIDNVVIVDAGRDTILNIGESTILGGNPTAKNGFAPYTYSWYPVEGLDNPNSQNPTSSPEHTTMYYVMVYPEKGCPKLDSVLVRIAAPEITTQFYEFPILICGSEISTSISISNTGLKQLVIDSMFFDGSDYQRFTFNQPFSKTLINVGKSVNFLIDFNSSITGNYSTVLVIKSNANPDSIVRIPVSVRKDSIAIEPEIFLIDFGGICLNESKDTVFSIINNGTAVAGAYLVSSALFSLTPNEIYLQPQEQANINLHYGGSLTKIDINSQIKIIDSICGYTKNINVTVKVSIPELSVSQMNIISSVGKPKDGIITITNTSDMDIIIDKPNIPDTRFQLISPVFPYKLLKYSSVDVIIRFFPNDTSHIELNFDVFGTPCNVSGQGKIIADAFAASGTLKIGNSYGYSGEIIDIPIYLVDTTNIYAFIGSTIQTEINFNSTILVPTLGTPSGSIESGMRNIPLEMPLQYLHDSTIAILKFKATLGNSENSAIVFNNAKTKLIEGEAGFNTIGGEFTLLGVCHEGGTRLIGYNGELSLFVNPNPANEELKVAIYLIEYGNSNISITNILGEKVFETSFNWSKEQGEGRKEFVLNCDSWSSGTYFIHLRTVSESKSMRLEILR